MFEYLKAYSPLHNIKNDGTRYPAIMVTTADQSGACEPSLICSAAAIKLIGLYFVRSMLRQLP